MARVDGQVDAGRLGLGPQRESSPVRLARRCLPRYSMRFMRLGSSELDMETGYTMRAEELKTSRVCQWMWGVAGLGCPL